MKYELTGRLVVEAASIDEAFKKVAEHFCKLAKGQESHIPEVGTDIKLKKLGTKTPVPPKPPKTPIPKKGG